MKLFYFVLVLMMGCVDIEKSKTHILTFSLFEGSISSYIKLSELGIEEIIYVPLETNQKCLISSIQEIKFGSDFYIIRNYNLILSFATDGTFISQIGSLGKGPQEYQNIHDFGINENNDYIYILSGWENKFYIYSKQGKYIRTTQCPVGVTDIMFTKEHILCYNRNNTGEVKNSFYLVSYDGHINKSFSNEYMFHVQLNSTFFQNENIFYKFNGQIIKKEMYSDTVYTLTDLSFTPRMVIRHGDKLLNPKIREDQSIQFIIKNYIVQRRLFEFGDKFYYEFLTDGELFCLLGSKTKNKQILVKRNIGFVNDIDGGPNIVLKSNKDDNTIISWVDAHELKAHVASDAFKNSTPKYPEKKRELERLANSLSENDNPVLMFVKLKE